jgi:hypothetical protein
MIKKLIKKYKRITVLTSPDKIKIIKNYNIEENRIYITPYIPYKYRCDYSNILPLFNDSKYNIVVGNNELKENNHIKILNDLKRYKNDNIRIICFLNYGIKSLNDYRKHVIEIGQEIYGDAFVYYDQMLENEQFISVIKSSNLIIINTNPDRQNALGTIYLGIYLDKYICLNEEGINYKWLEQNNIHTYKYDELITSNLQHIREIKNIDTLENKTQFINMLNINSLENKWKEFLC